jgi:predicted  nucleic acid-binding Zn-ribbon protein
MNGLRKFAALFVPLTTLLLLFCLSSPALADSTTDYNQKVAEAQAKINDLQSQLDAAQASLDSWTNSSNDQADKINSAQTIATEAKDALEAAEAAYISDKATYDDYFGLVVAAEQVVAAAIEEVNVAADLVDSTYYDYLLAQQNADNAQAQMNQAQNDYDTQLINVGGQGTTAGLSVDVYTGINRGGNNPARSDVAYTKCRTTTVPNIQADWGGGDILGCGSEYIMLHYKGYITYPTTTKVYFQAPADDGFYMSINGQPIINDWSLKGCGANSTGMFSFTGGKSYAIDAWFYEWTGGACSSLYYLPLNSNSWNVAPASFFSQTAAVTLVKDPTLKAILDNKTAFYVQAVAVEEQANVVYLDAEINYDGKHLNYSMLSQELAAKRTVLNGHETVMNDSESNWQNRSDDKAVADSDLRDLKAEYSTVFNAIQGAVANVDDLEARLAQAKVDLANIPKPTASSKRKPKKAVVKYFADGAYLPRATFVPSPK